MHIHCYRQVVLTNKSVNKYDENNGDKKTNKKIPKFQTAAQELPNVHGIMRGNLEIYTYFSKK